MLRIDFKNSGLSREERKEYLHVIDHVKSEYPNIYPEDITVKFSNRLKSAMGNCGYNRYTKKYEIKIAVKSIKEFGYERGLGTLKHEIAHILDFLHNGKFSHGYWFKLYCKALGGTMNPTMAKHSFSECASGEYLKTPFKFEYVCSCGNSFKTKGKLRRLHGRICAKCKRPVYEMKLYKLV